MAGKNNLRTPSTDEARERVNRVVAGFAPDVQTVMNVERALFGEWHAF